MFFDWFLLFGIMEGRRGLPNLDSLFQRAFPCKNFKGKKSWHPIVQDEGRPHKPDKEATLGEYLRHQQWWVNNNKLINDIKIKGEYENDNKIFRSSIIR